MNTESAAGVIQYNRLSKFPTSLIRVTVNGTEDITARISALMLSSFVRRCGLELEIRQVAPVPVINRRHAPAGLRKYQPKFYALAEQVKKARNVTTVTFNATVTATLERNMKPGPYFQRLMLLGPEMLSQATC